MTSYIKASNAIMTLYFFTDHETETLPSKIFKISSVGLNKPLAFVGE